MNLRKLLRKTRKGAFTSSIGVTRMAEAVKENKEHVITVSIILYLLGYALIGAGGISFQSQTATGYIKSTGNSGCTAGAVWVQSDTLRWCGDSSTEYWVKNEGGDHVSTDSATSPQGALWIQNEDIRYIGGDGTEYIVAGDQFSSESSPVGAIFIEDNMIHYIDNDGDEHTTCSDLDPNGHCTHT